MRAAARPPVSLAGGQVWRTPDGVSRTVVELYSEAVPTCRCRVRSHLVTITQSAMRAWILRHNADLAQPTPDLTTAATALLELIAMVEPTHRAAVVVFNLERDDVPVVYSNAAAMDLQPALATSLALVLDGSLRMPLDGGVRWVGEEEW